MVREGKLIQYLEQDFDEETAENVVDFYSGGSLPRGNRGEGYAKVKARLHRIMPEKFLGEEYSYENLNHAHSAVKYAVPAGDQTSINGDFYTQEFEPEDFVDASLMLDHSVMGGLLSRQDSRPNECVTSLERNEYLEPLFETALRPLISWKQPLGLLETVKDINSQAGEIDVYQPGDTQSRFKKTSGFYKGVVDEVFRYVGDDIENTWIDDIQHITNIQGSHGDQRIMDAANERDAILVTRDDHFLEMKGTAVTPDIAEVMLEQAYSNIQDLGRQP